MSGVANFYDGELDSTDKYNGRVNKFNGYTQLNHYHSDAMTDYFDTAYYVNIHVGKWDKPYELNKEGQRRTLKIAA